MQNDLKALLHLLASRTKAFEDLLSSNMSKDIQLYIANDIQNTLNKVIEKIKND